MIALLVCRNLQRHSTLHLHSLNSLFRRKELKRKYDPLWSPLQGLLSTQTLPQRTQESGGPQLHLLAMLQVLRSPKPFMSVSTTSATKSFPLLSTEIQYRCRLPGVRALHRMWRPGDMRGAGREAASNVQGPTPGGQGA